MYMLAEDVAGKCMHNVVVTFPVFYSQFECNMITDAVELASLHLLMLINDGMAVVVNYAMMYQFLQPK
jgi:molecular chaperone DnaK (HSP70)